MKLIIDIDDVLYYKICSLKDSEIDTSSYMAIKNGKPYEERPQCEWVEDIIEELESRKDYGAEYAQAMEDVIVILKAKFGMGQE